MFRSQRKQKIQKGAKEAGNAEELKKSQDQALTLKQDIARRQWEKKIPLSKLECYLKGTIKRMHLLNKVSSGA